MRILEVSYKNNIGLMGPDDPRKRVPGFNRVFDGPVRESQQPPLHGSGIGETCVGFVEDIQGRRRFDGALLHRPERRRLADGDIKQQHIVPLPGEFGDGPAHTEFLIVWMRADDEYVHGRRVVGRTGRGAGGRYMSYSIGVRLRGGLATKRREEQDHDRGEQDAVHDDCGQ